ncbi:MULTISPECIES: hypothetical protein [Alcaligenes]|uniref:hypothetical protein n=1 Tax=Alcaligenes TaxID=507 RepID=UPI00266B713A|nr:MULTISPECIES: hypothetical protein [Alcaligenes]MDV2115342.1 hypothetical protein [Alcaligenes faecalis]
MSYPTPETIAARLSQLHSEEFGGKTMGRYRIDRELFKDLANRDKLEKVVVDKVAKALMEDHGLILMDLGPYLAVLQAKKALAWRSATKKIVSTAVEDIQ